MAGRVETFVIEQSLPMARLDAFLRGRFPELSRGAIQRLILEGAILVNAQPVKATHHPRAGETVSIAWPEARPSEAQPEAIPLSILYEDADLVVLNKPPGLVVHPAAGHAEHTLVNALLSHCKGQLSGIGGVARPGIVHRQDKDTSGCLVAAKNDAATGPSDFKFLRLMVHGECLVLPNCTSQHHLECEEGRIDWCSLLHRKRASGYGTIAKRTVTGPSGVPFLSLAVTVMDASIDFWPCLLPFGGM